MNLNKIIEKIKNYKGRPIKIMEVCGTHTSSIVKNGIYSLLSPNIELVSGPGCPVCVTSGGYIDKLIEISQKENTSVLSFGDMLRVRGSKKSLIEANGNYKMIYSPFEAIELAKKNSDITYVLAAVGFETTAASHAALVDEIVNSKIHNIKLLTSIKTMPLALEYICNLEPNIDAFLCPGHVSVVSGSKPFDNLAKIFNKPFVISGFEAEHILCAIYEIITQIEKGQGKMANLYPSSVSYEGNRLAQKLLKKYFYELDALWRGIGVIKKSGLVLRPEYKGLDAGSEDMIELEDTSGCRCSDVLLGRIKPNNCALFGKACTPMNPVGACMVSKEGACGIYYENNDAIW